MVVLPVFFLFLARRGGTRLFFVLYFRLCDGEGGGDSVGRGDGCDGQRGRGMEVFAPA
jgi:hypothetical protein